MTKIPSFRWQLLRAMDPWEKTWKWRPSTIGGIWWDLFTAWGMQMESALKDAVLLIHQCGSISSTLKSSILPVSQRCRTKHLKLRKSYAQKNGAFPASILCHNFCAAACSWKTRSTRLPLACKEKQNLKCSTVFCANPFQHFWKPGDPEPWLYKRSRQALTNWNSTAPCRPHTVLEVIFFGLSIPSEASANQLDHFPLPQGTTNTGSNEFRQNHSHLTNT